MPDFGALKNRLKGAVSAAADRGRDLAEKAADKAKDASRIAKLSLEIAGEKDAIRRNYIELGRLYYETRGEEPEPLFAQLCGEIAIANERIGEKETQITAIKEGSDAEGDFESTVAVAEAEVLGDEPVPEAEPAGDEPAGEEPAQACTDFGDYCHNPASTDISKDINEQPCCDYE